MINEQHLWNDAISRRAIKSLGAKEWSRWYLIFMTIDQLLWDLRNEHRAIHGDRSEWEWMELLPDEVQQLSSSAIYNIKYQIYEQLLAKQWHTEQGLIAYGYYLELESVRTGRIKEQP